MRLLIIGGGKVGSFLAAQLETAGHFVAVIEQDPERARTVVKTTKVVVFEGDGTDVGLLRSADVHRADWVLAVTGEDETNLMAAQLALTLEAARVLARLNDPANETTFTALGIQAVAVTDLIGNVISREVAVPDLTRSDLFLKGEVEQQELTLPADFAEADVMNLDLPPDALLIIRVRGDSLSIVRGNTRLRAGDRVVVVSTPEAAAPVRTALGMEDS